MTYLCHNYLLLIIKLLSCFFVFAIILRKLPKIQDIVYVIHDLGLHVLGETGVAALHPWGQAWTRAFNMWSSGYFEPIIIQFKATEKTQSLRDGVLTRKSGAFGPARKRDEENR